MVKNDKKTEVIEKNNSAVEHVIKDENNKKGKKFVVVIFAMLMIICGGLAYNLYQMKTMLSIQSENIRKEYDGRISALQSRLNVIDREVATLRNIPTQVGLTDEDYSRILSSLHQQINVAVSSQKGENNEEQTISITPAVTSNEVMLASGSMIVKTLAEEGQSFSYEAEILKILAENNIEALSYISVLQKYATSGIEGKNMLINNFNKIYEHLSSSFQQANKTDAEDETFKDLLTRRVKELFIADKNEELKLSKETDDVHKLINQAKFAQALKILKTDIKYAELNYEPLNEWIKQAQDYVDFERAINGLIMNSLANIHLKEMDRDNLKN